MWNHITSIPHFVPRSCVLAFTVARVEEGDGKKVEDTVKSKRTAKEEKIDATTQELCEKHGEQFTGPQLRLWARMHLNGDMTA